MKTNTKNMKLVCLALAMLMLLGAYATARGTVGMVGKSSPSVQPMSVVSWTIGTDRPSSTKAYTAGSATIYPKATYATMRTFLQYKSGDNWKNVTSCSPIAFTATDYNTYNIASGGTFKNVSANKIYRGAVTITHKIDGITYTNNYRSSSF